MRTAPALLLLTLAAGLLGGCHVDTQGAACATDAHCPSDQRCGHDRTCSRAAAACAGPICAESECDGATLRRCVPDAQGVCASLQETTCSENQACHAATSSCDCLPSGCGAGVDGLCAPTGELVTCATEAATGCTYAVASEACPAHQECRPSGLTDATCECQPSAGCPGAGASCADGQHLVTCAQTNGCWHATPAVPCAIGEACGGDYPGAACACPAIGAGPGQGCGPAEGATSCAGDTLLTCALAAPGSACLTWQVAQVCSTGGLICSGGACACAASACTGPGSFCDGTGREVTCLQDATSGCWSEGPPQACAAGESCLGQAPAGACACPASGVGAGQGCGAEGSTACAGDRLLSCAPVTAGSSCNAWAPAQDCAATGLVCGGTGAAACVCPASACTGPGSFCDGAGREVTCQQDALNGCWAGGPPVACALGETCAGALPDGACACPADGPSLGQGCATLDARSCAAADLLRCAPVVEGSLCRAWSLEEACASSGLDCSAGASPACTCPPPGGPPTVHHADPTAPRRPGLAPTGAEPPLCRHLTLAAALAAAATGDTVKATGFAGAPVVFTEGPLTIPAGVALTTAETPAGTSSYVVEPAAGVGTATFVSLRPGASITGFRVRNVEATGVGLATSCGGAGDVAPVTIDTVLISGLGAGATPARFANGLRHSGNCSLTLTRSTIEEADDTGVVVSSPAAATSLTMTGNLIQRNQANVTRYSIGPAPDRSGGGLVFIGTVPGTVAFSANRLLSNAGDQVLVFSAGTLNLSTPACDASANVFACYPTGVGLSSKAGTVSAGHNTWWNPIPMGGIDFLMEQGSITGVTTLACPAFTGPCP